MNAVITFDDFAEAEQAADWADKLAADEWARVEVATRTAEHLEQLANEKRALAQRLRLQIGFRRVAS